jgi:hypothetical protein
VVPLPPNQIETSRATPGERRQSDRQQLCDPLIASPSALIGLTTLLGPVHSAFIYNAPLFCGGPATEP